MTAPDERRRGEALWRRMLDAAADDDGQFEALAEQFAKECSTAAKAVDRANAGRDIDNERATLPHGGRAEGAAMSLVPPPLLPADAPLAPTAVDDGQRPPEENPQASDPAGSAAPTTRAPSQAPEPVEGEVEAEADLVWSPPGVEPLDVPDDVLAQRPTTIEDPFSFDEPRRPRLRALQTRAKKSKGALVAAVAAAVALLVFGLLLRSCSPGASPAAEDSGPVQLNTPSTSAQKAADRILPHKNLTPYCASGSTEPDWAFRDDKTKAWVCVRAHQIDNNGLTVDFFQPEVVTRICVVPGFDHVDPNGKNLWYAYRLVTDVQITANGFSGQWSINPLTSGACYTFTNPVTTQQITLVVNGTARAKGKPDGHSIFSTDDDSVDVSFAISKIQIWGHDPK